MGSKLSRKQKLKLGVELGNQHLSPDQHSGS